MAKSSQFERVKSLIRARAMAPRKSLEEDRVSYETMLSALTVDDDISTERIGAEACRRHGSQRQVPILLS
jgi:hypothetical protein